MANSCILSVSQERKQTNMTENQIYVVETLARFFSPSYYALRKFTGCSIQGVDEDLFMMTLKLPLSVTGRKFNYLTVAVNGLDYVDVTCTKVSTRLGKTTTKVVHNWENLCGEDVARIFREATGVATHF